MKLVRNRRHNGKINQLLGRALLVVRATQTQPPGSCVLFVTLHFVTWKHLSLGASPILLFQLKHPLKQILNGLCPSLLSKRE